MKAAFSPLLLLRIAAFFLFAGYAWLYGIRHSSPLSHLLWNPENKAFIEAVSGMPWSEWMEESPAILRKICEIIGFLFALSAVSTIAIGRKWRLFAIAPIVFAMLLLCIHAWAHFEATGHKIPQLFEQALRIATGPALILLTIRGGQSSPSLEWICRVAIAFTFLGHAWFAAGFSPTPQEWYFMVTHIFPVETEGATIILRTAGWFDIVAAFLILIPWRPVELAGLAWCVGWGLATAAARPISHLTAAEKWYGLDPWLFEGLIRLPHGLVPLALMCMVLERKRKSDHSRMCQNS